MVRDIEGPESDERAEPAADRPEKKVVSDRGDTEAATEAPDTRSVEEKVVAIVASQMNVDPHTVTKETSFVNDLGADSLDTVELVMEFEDAFDITIPDKEAEKIQTVGDAIKYVEEHQ